MDVEWIYYPRDTKTYRDGAQRYVDNLCSNLGNPPTIRCPCCTCANMKWHEPKMVFCHICMNAMHPAEVKQLLHPEGSTSTQHPDVPETYYMLRDALCDDEVVIEAMDEMNDNEIIKIIEEAELPVFSGCPTTTIASIVSIFKYKARFNLPDKAIDELFPLIKTILPEGNTLPDSLYAARKVLKAFDLGYQKIHACVNDCCLFRKELQEAQACPKCGTSRWKVDKKSKKVMKRIPAKVLRYFPIIPRLRRMFKSVEKSEQLTWHDKHKSQDGKMRHPVDSPAWKHIDSSWPEFAAEPRNVRLGLAADGFNPFGDLSSRYSCWPVILVIYNLSPSLCMSKENLMLTLLIPGPKQPGNDIDVYLQPLIDDLNELWDKGVRVYDSRSESTFNLKAILMWTINDFPAYGNLSGYSTKGKKACPVCGVQTCSKWLENGKKHAYMGHRRWLPEDHPYRFKAGWFDGTVERRTKPIYLTGSQIFEVVKNIKNDWGKKVKKGRVSVKRKRAETSVDMNNESDDDGDNPFKLTKRWKKRSIFYDLPYWESSKQGAKRNKKQEMAAEAIAIALSLQNNMTVRISEPPIGSQGAPRTIETTNDVNSRTKGKGKATLAVYFPFGGIKREIYLQRYFACCKISWAGIFILQRVSARCKVFGGYFPFGGIRRESYLQRVLERCKIYLQRAFRNVVNKIRFYNASVYNVHANVVKHFYNVHCAW